jgi:LacI family transcriptional regulator
MGENVNNIIDLAARLGLSVTTVSRVLNGKSKAYRISTATREKVLAAASAYNYSPNRIARGLRLEKTETIGLIIPDISNPFFSSIAKIIELESRRFGYSLILCDSQDDISTENELINLLSERKVDGMILAPVGLNGNHIQGLMQKNIPVVVIDRYFPGTTIPYITTDNYQGAFMATEYFINCGHRRIACIQGLKGITSSTERVNGYRDALKKHKLLIDKNLVCGNDFGEENGYLQTLLLLNRNDPPTAIFALGNLISLGMLRAIYEKGLCIPDDISVITFDEQPYSAFLKSPMTTIEQPREKIAKVAVNVLFEAIHSGNGIDDQIAIKFEPRIIYRESVKKIVIQV